jgi:hypothetical protein
VIGRVPDDHEGPWIPGTWLYVQRVAIRAERLGYVRALGIGLVRDEEEAVLAELEGRALGRLWAALLGEGCVA